MLKNTSKSSLSTPQLQIPFTPFLKFMLFLYVFLDVLGFSLILPILPYLFSDSSTFSSSSSSSPSPSAISSPISLGFLFTSNALAQLLAAPILGHLSDRFGRRPLLLLCLAGTLLSFLHLSLASSWHAVLFSRILDGLLGGNISLAQAVIADVTSHVDRTRGMGLLGAAFGAGFTFGPALGGLAMSFFGTRFPIVVACLLALLNLVLVYFFLPESLRPPSSSPTSPSKPNLPSITPSALLRAACRPLRDLSGALLRHPQLSPLLIAKLALGCCLVLFETSFGLSNSLRFSLAPRFSSYLMSIVGVCFSLVQGLGASRLLALIPHPEPRMVAASFLLLALALAALALAPSVLLVSAALVPMALGLGALNTLLSSMISKTDVAQGRSGEILGITSSIGCITRIVAPLISTTSIAHLSPESPFWIASIIALVSFYNFKK